MASYRVRLDVPRDLILSVSGLLAARRREIGTRRPGCYRQALIRSRRCLGERGFALLTQRWQTLRHVTASPRKSARSPAPRSS